jgi:hypothetical protein
VAKHAFITPDFFSVAKELLGLPLASPTRRAVAMSVDLVLVGILAQAGGVFLGLVAVFLLIRASRRNERGGFIRESARLGVRLVAGIVLFLVIMKIWDVGESGIESAEHAIAARVANGDNAQVECRREPVRQDSLPAFTSAEDSLRSAIERLRAENQALGNESGCLRTNLERARENRGLRSFLGVISDDLGLGFGWAAVYFTGCLAMLRGQTPGKKLMGLRVIRLDNKPLGWWISFERFGGYAASFSVGLIGFLQILWDRNRQGLHDKACETVVVRDNPQAAARS